MNRASGKLVHRQHWNNHLVEIFDKSGIRSLYFGGNILQSSMSLTIPCRLVLSYTEFMMGTLLFNPCPSSILIVGVGAGSLLRYLYHHFPESHIDGVDNAALVFELADTYFNLPHSKNIHLACCDGHDFLSTGNRQYDLILIDAFDQEGMAPSIYCDHFFKQCRKCLVTKGLISLNLWSGKETRMHQVQTDLKQYFESIITLPVPNRGNIICIGAREENLIDTMENDPATLTKRGEQLQINLKKVARVCSKNNIDNRKILSRIFS